MTTIDWSALDRYTEDTCECHCGATYRSHAKYSMADNGIVSRRPCPNCGSDRNLRKVSHGSEVFTIGADDIDKGKGSD